MFQGLIFLAAIVGSLACYLNANETGCETPTESSCISVCSLYRTQTSCEGISGCYWKITGSVYGVDVGNCQPRNATNISTTNDCVQKANETTCGADTMCNWRTRPCKFTSACSPVGSSFNLTCFSLLVQAECTSSPGCEWGPTCVSSSRCGMLDDQSSCVANAGCYWSEYTRGSGGVVTKVCDSCFTDISNTSNAFLGAQARLGKACSVVNISVVIHSTIASASGCTGGAVPVSHSMYVCDGDDDNNSSSSSSSSSGSNGMVDLLSFSSSSSFVYAMIVANCLLFLN